MEFKFFSYQDKTSKLLEHKLAVLQGQNARIKETILKEIRGAH